MPEIICGGVKYTPADADSALFLDVHGKDANIELKIQDIEDKLMSSVPPEVYLPKPKVSVNGPGGVQATFEFRGAKNESAGQMLTVTLLNDLDGSQYA